MFFQGCLCDATKALTHSLGPLLESCMGAFQQFQEHLCHCGSPGQPFPGSGANPRGGRPLAEIMPLVFVGHLVSFLYAAFVFGYMPAAGVAFNSTTSMVFHGLIVMVLASYAKVCTTEPGSPPETPEWKTHGRPPVHLRERKAGSSTPRWCRKTRTYKPDRAHHCRISGRVVLRMDHHCPWVGNTIGFGNHKHFFLFLLYTVSACSLTSGALLRLLLLVSLPPSTVVFVLESTGVTLLLSSFLVPLFLFHCWLLGRNMTTIEFCEKRQVKVSPSNGAASSSKYDIGLYQNIASVLGENPFTWLLPIGGPPGDGLRYPERASTAASNCSKEKAIDVPTEDEDNSSTTLEECEQMLQTREAGKHGQEAAQVQEQDPLESLLASCACLNQLAQDAAARLMAICCGHPQALRSPRHCINRADRDQDPAECDPSDTASTASGSGAGASVDSAALGMGFL